MGAAMTSYDNVTFLHPTAPTGALAERFRTMSQQFADASDPLEADLAHVLRTMSDDLLFLRELLRELLDSGQPTLLQRRYAESILRALDAGADVDRQAP